MRGGSTDDGKSVLLCDCTTEDGKPCRCTAERAVACGPLSASLCGYHYALYQRATAMAIEEVRGRWLREHVPQEAI